MNVHGASPKPLEPAKTEITGDQLLFPVHERSRASARVHARIDTGVPDIELTKGDSIPFLG